MALDKQNMQTVLHHLPIQLALKEIRVLITQRRRGGALEGYWPWKLCYPGIIFGT